MYDVRSLSSGADPAAGARSATAGGGGRSRDGRAGGRASTDGRVGVGASSGGDAGGGSASGRCRSSAITGARCFASLGGAAARRFGDGGADAAGGGGTGAAAVAGATGGWGLERCAGASCTANALTALPACAADSDKSCIRGNSNQSAARWSSSDSATATQRLGMVTTSCRLAGGLRQLLIMGGAADVPVFVTDLRPWDLVSPRFEGQRRSTSSVRGDADPARFGPDSQTGDALSNFIRLSQWKARNSPGTAPTLIPPARPFALSCRNIRLRQR